MANNSGRIEINAVQYDFAKLLALKSYAHVEAVPATACRINADCREIPLGSEPFAVEVTVCAKKTYIVFAKNPEQDLKLEKLDPASTRMLKVRIYSKFGLKKAKPENATVEPAYEQERPRYNEGRHEGRYQGGYQGNNYQGGYQSQGYQGNRPRFAGADNNQGSQANRSEPFRPAGTFQQHQPQRDNPQRTGNGQTPDPRGGALLNRPHGS